MHRFNIVHSIVSIHHGCKWLLVMTPTIQTQTWHRENVVAMAIVLLIVEVFFRIRCTLRIAGARALGVSEIRR
jgi:hypothetical protein